MKYLDSARPVVNGFPMLLKGATPLCSIPNIYLGPEADGRRVVLTCFLPQADNSFRAFYGVVGDLTAFWLSWMEDPEQTLEIVFGYKYDQVRQQAAPSKAQAGVVSELAELGLD